jgi:hypothetical protein
MFRSLVAFLFILAVIASPVQAQSSQSVLLDAVQGSTGALFLTLGQNAWPLVPNQVTTIFDVSSGINIATQEIDGTFYNPAITPVQGLQQSVVQDDGGTLYLVQGHFAIVMVPHQISDDDLAALTLGSEIDGAIPVDLGINITTPTTVPATTDQPPVAVVPTVTTQSCQGVPTGATTGGPSYAPILAPCKMLTLGQPVTGALNMTHSISNSDGKLEAYYGALGFGDPYVVHLLKDHKYLIRLDTNNYLGNGKDFYKDNPALPDAKDGKGKVAGHAWVVVWGDGANLFLPNGRKTIAGSGVSANPTSIFRALFWAWQPSGTSCLAGPGTESAGFNDCIIQPQAEDNYSLAVVRSGTELYLAGQANVVYEPAQYSLSISEAP